MGRTAVCATSRSLVSLRCGVVTLLTASDTCLPPLVTWLSRTFSSLCSPSATRRLSSQLSPLPRFCLALWQVPSPTLLCTLSFTCVLFWALTWARLRSTVVWATALRRLSRTTASCLSTTVLPLLPLVLSFTEVHSSVCRTPSRLSTLTRKISLLSAWPPSSLLRKSPFLLPASSPTLRHRAATNADRGFQTQGPADLQQRQGMHHQDL